MNGESAVRELASEPGAELRETHGSWVVLTADRALKIKKPVKWSFLDYTTLEARRHACIAEVEINQLLAPGIYLGVRPLQEVSGKVVVGPADTTEGAFEFAIEMRRFDEGLTVAAELSAGTLDEGRVVSVGKYIAAFHAQAERVRVERPCEQLQSRIQSDIADLAELDVEGCDRWLRFGDGLLARKGDEIERRAAAGLVRDGHGDLRADHVLLTQPIMIVDRLEFDRTLRAADVADDLAFLTMDLESRGGRWAADLVVAAYDSAGGMPASSPLAAGFAWRRALIRTKTALLRDNRSRAEELISLSERLAWRARAEGVLVVCGPPASGKSTLANQLAEMMELPTISSDRVRKASLGLDPLRRAPDDAYAPEMSRRVYDQLVAESTAALNAKPGVIIDANFGRAADRQRLTAAFGSRVRWVWCDPPVEVLLDRARRRESDPARISDAGPEVAARLSATYEPLNDLRDSEVLHLTAADQSSACDDIARWLDSRR